MASLNKVTLIGNLGKDPEVRTFGNGGKVCNFSIATSEKWKDKQSGEQRERTEWHNITVNSDGLIGVCERYLKKGSKVYVEGKLQTRKWKDRDGNDRYSTDVVLSGYGGKLIMLDSRQGGGGSGGSGGYSSGGGGSSSSKKPKDDFELDDEIPF